MIEDSSLIQMCGCVINRLAVGECLFALGQVQGIPVYNSVKEYVFLFPKENHPLPAFLLSGAGL